MIYEHDDGRQFEVGKHEKARIGALERAGFKKRAQQDKKKTGLAALVNEDVAAALKQAGFGTVAAVRKATDEALLAVDGVGDATLKDLREGTAK